ncbi:MAG: PqqD family peptide modification chaperone [Candidatus Aenigmatarchaeota archaeon]
MALRISDADEIRFFRISSRKDGDEYIIGRQETEDYVGVPETGLEIIRLLQAGKTVEQAAKAARKKYGRTFDVKGFVRELAQDGLVRSIGGTALKERKKAHYLFPWLKPRHVSWLFSKPAYFAYVMFVTFAIFLVIANPDYVPRYEDFFFSQSYTFIAAVSFVLGIIMVTRHEFSHFLAAISCGIKADFGIDYRLYYLVAVTDVTNVWRLPRIKRLRIYFAGMASDVLFISLFIFAMFLSDTSVMPIPYNAYLVLRYLVLMEILGLAWQFMFFMKTDIYLILENLLKTEGLYEKSLKFISQEFMGMLGRGRKQRPASAREYTITEIFSAFFLAGTTIAVVSFLFFDIPIVYELFTTSIANLFSSEPQKMLDSMAFLLIFGAEYGLLGYAVMRGHFSRKSRKPKHSNS